MLMGVVFPPLWAVQPYSSTTTGAIQSLIWSSPHVLDTWFMGSSDFSGE